MTTQLRPPSSHAGFTLIEVMVVVAVAAILGLVALPSYYYRVVRQQIEGANPLISVAETRIAATWTTAQTLPADNTAAGLPSADMIVNNYVSAVSIQNGAINLTFGNRATNALNGKVLTIRPAVVASAPIVPITWVCGNAAAPHNMTMMGANQTTIAPSYLPPGCK